MRLNVGDVLDSLDINADWKSDKPCVKRVKDIFEKPSFFLDGAKGNDVRQGRLGNCWMAAAVSAVTNKSGLIERLCPARNEEVGVYGFVFHRDGEWSTTIVDDHLFLIHDDFSSSKNLNGRRLLEITGKDFDDEDITAEQRYRELYQRGSSALYYGKCQDPNETWFPLLEKAYAKAHGVSKIFPSSSVLNLPAWAVKSRRLGWDVSFGLDATTQANESRDFPQKKWAMIVSSKARRLKILSSSMNHGIDKRYTGLQFPSGRLCGRCI
ncbi:cysteine proteinase [Acephala macrosclerotiorum]|nr:cysteine proteinase [Acephala macrosclerotiorum]